MKGTERVGKEREREGGGDGDRETGRERHDDRGETG